MSLRHPPRFSLLAPAARATSWRIGALALALFAGVACGEDDPNPVEPPAAVDIVLSDTSITLIRGQTPTRQINASVTGSSNAGLTWTTGNSSIATVSQAGLVTAVADGQTFVTAVSAADPTKNRSVVVNVVSTVVTVTPATTFSYVGGPTRQVTATVANNSNTTVTWRSSNEAVATVSATGLVTPVGVGTASIFARSVGDATKEAATSITVDPAPLAGYTALTSGTGVAVSGATGENAKFYIVVPPGRTMLRAQLAGSTSQDADLYLYAGNSTATNMDNLASGGRLCNPWLSDSNEVCTVNDPQPRIYYVIVNAYTAYSGATLTVTLTP
jgi:hypothetical protein